MKTKSPLLRLHLHQSGLLLAALALLAAPQAQAQLYTGSNSTGLWSSSRWSTDTNGPFNTAWGNNSDAVFLADTAYTFTGGDTINIGNVTVGSGASVVFSAVSGTLGTDGNVRTLDVGANAILDLDLQPLSTASGTGFIKTGDGVYATGAGSYKSGFTLNGGTVVLRGTTGLGSGGANVLTLSNGVIAANDNRILATNRFPGGIRIAGNFQLGALSNSYTTNAQALIDETANISFANDVSLEGANRTITLGGNGNGEFSGVISNGGLTVTAGAGVTSAMLKLTGTNANTYSGTTTVNDGTLLLAKTAGVNAVAGGLTIGDGTNSDTVSLGASDQIADTVVVNMIGTASGQRGNFQLLGFNETIGGLSGGGQVQNASSTADSVLTLNVANATTQTSSAVLRNTGGSTTGSLSIVKTGGGTQILGGNMTYTGPTTVGGGLLVVNGSIASSAVTVDSGGTLAGSGSVGGLIVNTGGTISPGSSPGNLTVANTMLWNGGGNYNWQVLGTTDTPGDAAGTTWDLITVTGALDLTALTTSSKFNINLWSLSSTGPDTNGNIAEFNPTTSYEWLAVSASSINGFDATHFAVNVGAANGTGGFSNPLGGGYVFGVRQVGGNLYVTYGSAAPIPEPGTWAAMAIFAGGAAYAGWRRRKSAKVSE